MAQILTPSYLVDYINDAAVSKAVLNPPRLLVMAMLGGIYISLGGLLALVVAGGATRLLAENPGLDKLLFGAMFPVGFIAVVLTGDIDLAEARALPTEAPWQPAVALDKL